MKLVIVESPTKAKTIKKFLGRGYNVTSSYGHIRDLPKSKLGVDVEHDFAPHYIIPTKSRKIVTALKKEAAKAEGVILATDSDREGEAIAWHLAQLLNLDETKTARIAFHEITKEAIQEALEHPRVIDPKLVDAQQARRILDRLVGYELSPFLWRKIYRGLSAGRVQSVAVRLIVEREREVLAFIPKEYWTLDAIFSTDKQETIGAKLYSRDNKALDKFALTKKDEAESLVVGLKKSDYEVSSVKRRRTKKSAPPPFTTSLLQQEASRRLNMSPKQTMMLAQQLYEGVKLGEQGNVGLITYMRTDSMNLSEKFLQETKKYLNDEVGKAYGAAAPRFYKSKSKNAQEAHEAIRPTNPRLTPEEAAKYLEPRQQKLYGLIWRRAIASQMPDAEIETTSVDISAKTEVNGSTWMFRGAGSVIIFDGWRKLYPDNSQEQLLPNLSEGEKLALDSLVPTQHFTEPPPRYSEATLIKALEEYGIGRPSTYAPTVSTIVERGYVERVEKNLRPTELAILVSDLLVEHFPKIVDYEFTAGLENELDDIAAGTKQMVPVLKEFYEPFKANLMAKETEIKKENISQEKTDEVCTQCGKPMVIKMGRFGKFMACSGWPECKNAKPLPGSEEAQKTDEVCAQCGKPMQIKRGRYGVFLGCTGYPDCKNIKRIEKKIGMACPRCKEGELVVKRGRRGPFYGCNRYPDCDFVVWSKPTGEKCPDCDSLLVFAAGGKVRCSSKACKYTTVAQTDNEAEA